MASPRPPAAASTTTLGYGSSGVLRIAVVPASAVSVRIERRTATNPQWAEVATMATGLDGTVQLTVKPLLTTDYRTVLVDENYRRAAALEPASSGLGRAWTAMYTDSGTRPRFGSQRSMNSLCQSSRLSRAHRRYARSAFPTA